jgi:hypothetical protein
MVKKEREHELKRERMQKERKKNTSKTGMYEKKTDITYFTSQNEVMETILASKSSVVWDMMKVNLRFGEIYWLHLQDRRLSKKKKKPTRDLCCLTLVAY